MHDAPLWRCWFAVVLHLWDNSLVDLKALGIQTLYPGLTSGSIHHIETLVLQCVLLKVALLVGVKVVAGVAFNALTPRPSTSKNNSVLRTLCAADRVAIDLSFDSNVSEADRALIAATNFDALYAADGEHSLVAQSAAFQKRTFRGGLSIGITANFVNRNTEHEILPEFAIARHFHQRRFAGMYRPSQKRDALCLL
jgi:hypothetical protein